MAHPEVERLIDVMTALRVGCPWDAEQTHRSLVTYLVEEAAEVWMAAEFQSHAEASEEISQLLYHVQVMMIAKGISLDDVYRYL